MDTVFMGPDSGPPTHLNYKRGVLKPAPREFTIEILSPVKHGGNYSYGVRVCPVSRLVSDTRSVSSRASNHTEYEIWRRWEDCLDFQTTLETEYEQLSRRKVRVLKRGGKKHDGESIYSQSNGAASFDSLPEGPDPREVVLNVHELIPLLNKKGTLFRPSRATIEQRGAEFAAMMHGLFNPDPDAPVLLRELRNSQTVRDFFGFWRRDKDTAEKYGTKMLHSNRSLSSIRHVPGQDYPPLPSPASTVSPPPTPLTPTHMTEAARIKRDATATVLSQTSQSKVQYYEDSYFPTIPSSSPQDGLATRNPPKPLHAEHMTFTDELLMDDTNSHYSSEPWQNHPHIHNIPIAEDRGYRHRPHLPQQPPPPVPPPSTRPTNAEPTRVGLRPRSNSSTAPDYRRAYTQGAELHPMPLRSPEGLMTRQQQTSSTAPNHSLQTFSSNPSLRDRHEPTLKSPPSTSNFSQTTSISSRFSNMSLNRSSVNSSVSAFTHMSKSSQKADIYEEGECEYDDISAAFPSPPLSSHRTPLSNIDEGRPAPNVAVRDYRSSMASVRTEVSADGVLPPHLREAWGLNDDDDGSERDSFVDSYLAYPGDTRIRKGTSRNSHRYSGSSLSSSGSFGSTGEQSEIVAIKAAYHEHIVMFRADRSSSLRDIHQRIRERLVLHESVPMKAGFVLAYIPSSSSKGQRNRGLALPTVSDTSRLRLLQNDMDWQTALSGCNSKISIRVLDLNAVPRYI
ncbi:hypothetical protein Clacol_002575 [Clathrus columnatus]|uniref:PX domain-containing protein n=1 Tax=Clathrus columnatus TaxID=1419009 RepID=A0AAV5A725_9AGAM|nr:hypothetical protein Clacol_002575 [Clathrus columnatus]